MSKERFENPNAKTTPLTIKDYPPNSTAKSVLKEIADEVPAFTTVCLLHASEWSAESPECAATSRSVSAGRLFVESLHCRSDRPAIRCAGSADLLDRRSPGHRRCNIGKAMGYLNKLKPELGEDQWNCIEEAGIDKIDVL